MIRASQVLFNNCPVEDQVVNNSGAFPYAYTIPEITANVNSSGVAASVTLTSSPPFIPGVVANFPINTAQVLPYTATAPGEDNAICSFTLYVYDTGVPTYPSCPENPLIFNTSNSDQATATWDTPIPTDNSADDISESMQTFPDETSGAMFPIGDSMLTYSATDGSGNTGYCYITIRVLDTGDPVVYSYPENMTANTDFGQPTAVVNWTAPNATDNSGIVLFSYETNGTSFNSPSYNFPIGLSEVAVTVADPSGNNVTGEFYITVQGIL
ncbi:hyalin-like [Anneissia japonica]|uniref:hyalin-like n=1 Tax=Anneissia japonica TaxID=1529436 RepID=UPI00142574D5|nr:hyalin-like [Anneissia japonica]